MRGSWEFMSLVLPRVNVLHTEKENVSKNNSPAVTGSRGSALEGAQRTRGLTRRDAQGLSGLRDVSPPAERPPKPAAWTPRRFPLRARGPRPEDRPLALPPSNQDLR